MKMLALVFVWVLGMNNSLAATEGSPIYFHLGCYDHHENCTEIEFYNSALGTTHITKEPEMVVTRDHLRGAELVKDQFGIERLNIAFVDSASKKFAKLTGDNVRKVLVVVMNGKALINPTINEAIRGGRVEISAGGVKRNEFIDEIPWLKELIEDTKSSKEGWSLFSILSFILLGVLIIGGSIYFAFVRKAATKESAQAVDL